MIERSTRTIAISVRPQGVDASAERLARPWLLRERAAVRRTVRQVRWRLGHCRRRDELGGELAAAVAGAVTQRVTEVLVRGALREVFTRVVASKAARRLAVRQNVRRCARGGSRRLRRQCARNERIAPRLRDNVNCRRSRRTWRGE